MAGGRPRAFDVDDALDRALDVFWRQGYEGTALSDLTAAMGINRPSLYATFGNKEALFRKVLDRYAQGPAAYAARALELPRARDVVEALIYGAIELTTGPDTPLGCINVRTAQACGDASAEPGPRATCRQTPTRAPWPSLSPRSSTASPSRPAGGRAARSCGAPPTSPCGRGQRPVQLTGPSRSAHPRP